MLIAGIIAAVAGLISAIKGISSLTDKVVQLACELSGKMNPGWTWLIIGIIAMGAGAVLILKALKAKKQ